MTRPKIAAVLWTSGENAERGYGHYAVTETTFRSLRKHFELD